MRVRVVGWLLVVAGLGAACAAQTTHTEIEARLLHKELYLRGLWRDDKLKFDGAGVLVGKSAALPFTLCGIEVEKVSLDKGRLEVEGRRVGLEFHGNTPERVGLKGEKIHVEIAAPVGGDYTSAVDAVFSDLPGLVPGLPAPWQGFATWNLAPGSTPALPTPTPRPPKVRIAPLASRAGSGVVPPKVLYAPEPVYNGYARAAKLSGNVLLYVQVDTDGKPINLRILRPLGLGLDEQALLAVHDYRFQAAIEGGVPVVVELNVEVNFHIF